MTSDLETWSKSLQYVTEELVAPKSLKEIKMAFEINEKKFSNLRQRKEKCSQLQLVYES